MRAPGWGGSTAPALQGEVRNCCGKSKTGNIPPQNHLPHSSSCQPAPGVAAGRMEVAKLSWSPATHVAVHRGCAGEASAEGASPDQGPAVPPGPLCWRPLKPREWGLRSHLPIQTSECALAAGSLYSLIFTAIFLISIPSAIHGDETDSPLTCT